MGFSSIHVCMDSSDWLQGTINDESGLDSSSSPSGDMLTCSRPLIERRLRPPHDQTLKCPRCDSTHTKFCYYNNYSLSQPRYFCKTCRRYWTKGGTLRNIPVGGGCRKNKKISAKKSNDPTTMLVVDPQAQSLGGPSSSSLHNPTDLQLSFPEVPFSHLNNLFGSNLGCIGNSAANFMEGKYNAAGLMLDHPRPIDFMESKLEGMIGNSRNFDFMGNSNNNNSNSNADQMGLVGGIGEMSNGHHGFASSFHPGFGMSVEAGNGAGGTTSYGNIMDSCQRLMLPFDANEDHENGTIDVKPNPKLLSLEWQDQGGYLNGLGSWTGVMNGYGSSTTNPLI